VIHNFVLVGPDIVFILYLKKQVGKRATATYYVAATAAPAAAAYAFLFELKAKPLCACVWFLFLGTGGSELLDNRISGPVAVGEGGYRGL
jgi:hypothetical protein